MAHLTNFWPVELRQLSEQLTRLTLYEIQSQSTVGKREDSLLRNVSAFCRDRDTLLRAGAFFPAFIFPPREKKGRGEPDPTSSPGSAILNAEKTLRTRLGLRREKTVLMVSASSRVRARSAREVLGVSTQTSITPPWSWGRGLSPADASLRRRKFVLKVSGRECPLSSTVEAFVRFPLQMFKLFIFSQHR